MWLANSSWELKRINKSCFKQRLFYKYTVIILNLWSSPAFSLHFISLRIEKKKKFDIKAKLGKLVSLGVSISLDAVSIETLDLDTGRE